jgi:HEPN domain-containing protein
MKPPDEAKLVLVRQWIEKAEKDSSLARHLIAEGCFYPEALAFHPQQASEKVLKAFLVLHQVDFPKTHNLGELLDRAAVCDNALAAALNGITALNPFGVEYRYPGDFPELMQDDARDAFHLAEKAWDIVSPLIYSRLENSHREHS